ncbi:thioredoxin-like protein [Durotheca rogersii]|uniref:thioredoxin-like protein n=1 Tax=Durotheca rogersii TaxID=419775 RepID=UPI00221EC848|nr:thioredoxin-like protein [Durotheca rogersii]KAI5862874.1 thioredoxin-like protein [Durotheca rogersii]
MAPFGTIYTKELNPRTTAILAVAKANGLDLDVVEVDTTNPTPEFLKVNPLSKVPAFVGNDGYVLTECMAIAIYRMYLTTVSQ